MRTLHTLKGGARLAGAMRLGEMATGSSRASSTCSRDRRSTAADLEALQSRGDALLAAFEALRSRDAQAYAGSDRGGAAGRSRRRQLPATVLPMLEPEAEPEAEAVAEPVAASVPEIGPVDAPKRGRARAVRARGRARAAVRVAEAEASAAAPEPGEPPVAAELPDIDWSRFAGEAAAPQAAAERSARATMAVSAAVRVRAPLLDRLVNQAGEVSITRTRIESEVRVMRASLNDLTENLERLRQQLREIELQAETQMSSRMEAAKAAAETFDPLEFDRFTRFQELTRMMAESVNDVATVQRSLQRTVEAAEDELAAQTRLTRELQDDLLRTRMVEFESLSDRLYRVVRQAAKETGKQVRLDIVGGAIEVDRGVLDRMTASFEHLLRNCVTHGIESAEARTAAGKDPVGYDRRRAAARGQRGRGRVPRRRRRPGPAAHPRPGRRARPDRRRRAADRCRTRQPDLPPRLLDRRPR